MRKKKFMFILLLLSTFLALWAYSFFFWGVERNISYGDNPRKVMDVYLPKESLKKDTLVVFVYGGAWRTGSKNYYGFIGKYFAKLGYPTIIPDYRLYPEVQFPLFIDDVAIAIKKAESIGFKYDDIILVGHSAGGHTAALLAADPSYFQKHNIEKPIKLFIGLSAPYDLPFDEELTPIFETSMDDKDKTNAVALANTSMPPVLLLHGKDDTRVGLHHTENLINKLKELEMPVETRFIDGYSHSFMIISFLPGLNLFTEAPRTTRHKME